MEADERQQRRHGWWGPPSHPATFEQHGLTPGGVVTYFMTGPDGERTWGTWRVTTVEPPTSLEFADAFADIDGAPITDLPMSRVRVRLTEHGGRTRMEIRSKFESREGMERRLSMGEVEGLRQAVGQMDALLVA